MKKNIIFVVCAVLISAFVLTGFSPKPEETATYSKDNPITLKIGASPVPHAEILKSVKDTLAEKGINLEIIEFTDYVQPNTALEDGSLDANFFQHFPYLDDFNKARLAEDKNWTELVPLVYTHFEPMAIYGGKTKTLAEIKEGAKIAVPNDATNEARALLLLQANGLIKITEGKGLEATAKDIVENPKKIQVVELEAAQVARSLADVDFAVINGNYALEAGLTTADVLAAESAESEAAQKYANLVAVRKGEEELPQFKALSEALTSESVRKMLEDTYKGSVAPVF
ncbi:MetQ/NlpA family ABC transporter substrate-binding protein [Flexilinea flocculi]|jgi:D-methionine transport system substrate-binding protein|uniref:Lipoprotein n=1 Tax=Flexilinea flocculi TaxID=1678840 RepID=A0A0S7BN70_9CHLR|nr:MetQ/NlpA family ABC transporter substrate-binding protein [Flexilinea flocculi]NMB93599.1 MetQ/NlpA family ABC transporter substrate-binding protein [Flexilinea flocculi]GAP41756.1 ABC-type metal ion transport system, periplasmic component [Flexilinea flocculi]